MHWLIVFSGNFLPAPDRRDTEQTLTTTKSFPWEMFERNVLAFNDLVFRGLGDVVNGEVGEGEGKDTHFW